MLSDVNQVSQLQREAVEKDACAFGSSAIEEVCRQQNITLWTTHHNEIFINQPCVWRRTCQRFLGDAHATEDATQAVFLVYWRKRRQLVDHPQPLAWFQRTAVLVCKQALRSQRRRRYHEQQAAQQTADSTVQAGTEQSDSDTLRQLEAALAELPQKRSLFGSI